MSRSSHPVAPSRPRIRGRRLAAIGLAATAAALISATTAVAPPPSCSVVNGSGPSTGDLAGAIAAATAGDTLKVSGTCIGNFVVDKDLTLSGQGKNATLNGGGTGTTLLIQSGSATVRSLTITGGLGSGLGPDAAGGITVAPDAALDLQRSRVVNNHSELLAGGIATAGDLNLTDTVVSGNTTTLAGGGILAIDLGASRPAITLLRSSVRNNSAVGLTGNVLGIDLGGGIAGGIGNVGGDITLTKSSVTGNTAAAGSHVDVESLDGASRSIATPSATVTVPSTGTGAGALLVDHFVQLTNSIAAAWGPSGAAPAGAAPASITPADIQNAVSGFEAAMSANPDPNAASFSPTGPIGVGIGIGGGIVNIIGLTTLDHSSVSSNVASGDVAGESTLGAAIGVGGGIVNVFGGTAVNTGTIGSNVARGTVHNGIGIASGGGSFTFFGGTEGQKLTVSNNRAIANIPGWGLSVSIGGGLVQAGPNGVLLDKSAVTGNVASAAGSRNALGLAAAGGIASVATDTTLTNSTVKSNVARGNRNGGSVGGGIASAAGLLLPTSGATTLTNTKVQKNSATSGGGLFTAGTVDLTVDSVLNPTTAAAVTGNTGGNIIYFP